MEDELKKLTEENGRLIGVNDYLENLQSRVDKGDLTRKEAKERAEVIHELLLFWEDIYHKGKHPDNWSALDELGDTIDSDTGDLK